MSFDTMLNHTCDIYHVQKADKSPGYGLPSSPSFSYVETPDLSGVQCHFSMKSGVTVVQADPQAKYAANIKLILPLGIDVRLNDKVVDCDSGYEYTAAIPRKIRGHHIAVLLHRSNRQEAL